MYCIRAPPRRGRYWEIHPRRPRDFPRPERFPEGEARGKSRGSREILRAEGMDFPIPPSFWWSTDTFSHHRQGRIDFNTVNPSLSRGMNFLIHLCRWISLGLRPRKISRVSGNLLAVGDGFPNTSLLLVEHGYITFFHDIFPNLRTSVK